MNKEELPPPPPPPPPSRPLGFRQFHAQRSKKMNKKDFQFPPLLQDLCNLRSVQCNINSRRNMEMDKKKVPPPPPPPDFLARRKLHPRIRFYESIKSHDQNARENPRCPLSHPTHDPHGLSPIPYRIMHRGCFSCGGRTGYDYFFCEKCDVKFHQCCHMFPRKLTHPYHPHHPLTFTFRNYETGIISDGNIDEYFASAVLSDSSTSKFNAFIPNKSGSVQASRPEPDIIFDKCRWCGKQIEGNWYYQCSICNFILDLYCSQHNPLAVIANPKSHHHSLVLYPRPFLNPCDACGLVNVLEPSYGCFQCNYMVHQSCIDLPRVIKITRHQHRLSHTPYLQSTISLCRICYTTVDTAYGLYSCNHGDCSYVVHSKCATHDKVWDGNELEWEPEESDETEDIAPFKKVGDDLIKHFSHEHHLKLEKYDDGRDAEKQCQACILPINSHDFYNCIQCDFFLHEVCAGLLRKLDHALHVHPLVLESSPPTKLDLSVCSVCSVCSRNFSGFKYKCSNKKCAGANKFQIDVCCTLVPDYFAHKAHEHPLFISTSNKDIKICCAGCKEICLQSYLQCSSACKFAMCYKCATIPDEVRYKFDKHSLSLCYGEVPDGIYWCEVCEKKMNPKDWFYECNKCCITIHLQCVFGPSAYMKPGSILDRRFTKKEVFGNNKSTRPFCTKCRQRCPSSVYYKIGWLGMMTLCSLSCLATLTTQDKLILLSS